MSAPPILGDWDDRLHAESIRLLLAYANVTYEENRYELGPPPSYDASMWTDAQDALGLALPVLPYWIEPHSGIRLTHEHAILWHLAEAHGLAGETPTERATARMVLEALRAWGSDFVEVTCCNAPGTPYVDENVHNFGEAQCRSTSHKFELRRAAYCAETLPQKLVQNAALLAGGGGGGAPRTWIAGTALPSVADFVLGELLAQSRVFEPGCLDGPGLEPLRAFLDRFDTLPQVSGSPSQPFGSLRSPSHPL